MQNDRDNKIISKSSRLIAEINAYIRHVVRALNAFVQLAGSTKICHIQLPVLLRKLCINANSSFMLYKLLEGNISEQTLPKYGKFYTKICKLSLQTSLNTLFC